MKNKYFILFILIFLSISCLNEKDSEIIDDISSPEYNLPKGEKGSVDRKIYDIYEKYGTFILYSFEDKDFKRKWTGKWNKWYVPANKSKNLKYVDRFVDFLDNEIFSKYEPEFIKNNFPYKVFLVDSLADAVEYSKYKLKNVLSNGNNAIAVSNVGVKSDEWTEEDWNMLAADVNNAFTIFYYSSLKKKPLQFLSLRTKNIKMQDDPLEIETKYNYSCYSAGYVSGWLGKTYLAPKEEEDFAAYIRFLTANTGTYLNQVLERFPLMKTRSISLYIFLKNKMNMDLVATQNANFPNDKITVDLLTSK